MPSCILVFTEQRCWLATIKFTLRLFGNANYFIRSFCRKIQPECLDTADRRHFIQQVQELAV